MITIKALLNKIKWDKNLKPENYVLCYYDRIDKSLKELRFIDIDAVDGNFIVINKNKENKNKDKKNSEKIKKIDNNNNKNNKTSKEIYIPLHRIRKVKENNKIMWER